MKRITKRFSDGMAFIPNRFRQINGNDYQNKIAEKLAEYEDSEEQGLLYKLPCKIGDVLWSYYKKGGFYLRQADAPYPYKVIFIGINNAGGYINVLHEATGTQLMFGFEYVGKYIFYTREEAVAAMDWRLRRLMTMW